jgi:hypothetical protein
MSFPLIVCSKFSVLMSIVAMLAPVRKFSAA